MYSADRNQGVDYANDLAESCRQVRTYVTNLETEMKERTSLIEMLEQSEVYYDAQASEANTVAMVSICLPPSAVRFSDIRRCCCCCHDEPVRHCLYMGTDVPKR